MDGEIQPALSGCGLNRKTTRLALGHAMDGPALRKIAQTAISENNFNVFRPGRLAVSRVYPS